MSNQKLVVEGSDILSSQMMNFWRQVGDRSITYTMMDRFLAGIDPIDGSMLFPVFARPADPGVSAEQQQRFWEHVIAKKITSLHLQDMMERRDPFETRVLTIDRSSSFDPDTFINYDKGWRVVQQEDDQDSLALSLIAIKDIRLVNTRSKKNAHPNGEEELGRLKTDYIRLDAGVLQALLENQDLIPDRWKGSLGPATRITFDGTILIDSSIPRERRTLALYWDDKRLEWDWYPPQLYSARSSNCWSAVLPKPKGK